MNEKTIIDLMQALSNMYEKSSEANKVYLNHRLVNLKMGEDNLVTIVTPQFWDVTDS